APEITPRAVANAGAKDCQSDHALGQRSMPGKAGPKTTSSVTMAQPIATTSIHAPQRAHHSRSASRPSGHEKTTSSGGHVVGRGYWLWLSVGPWSRCSLFLDQPYRACFVGPKHGLTGNPSHPHWQPLSALSLVRLPSSAVLAPAHPLIATRNPPLAARKLHRKSHLGCTASLR